VTLDEAETFVYRNASELRSLASEALHVGFREVSQIAGIASDWLLAFAATHNIDVSHWIDIASTLATFVFAGIISLFILDRFEYKWPLAQGWARVFLLLFGVLTATVASYVHYKVVGVAGLPALKTMLVLVGVVTVIVGSYLLLNIFQVMFGHNTFIGKLIAVIFFATIIAVGAAFQDKMIVSSWLE
jgi:hypothetical protein